MQPDATARPPVRTLDIGTSVLGTVLALLPIAATLVLSLIGTIADRALRFAFLMPAELFPVYALGAVLLVIAAFRARRWRGWLLGAPLAAVTTLAGAQGLAILTGLADGTHDATGWRVVVVDSLLALSVIAMIVTGVVGWRLAREVWRDASDQDASGRGRLAT